jgi:hypothetical protein
VGRLCSSSASEREYGSANGLRLILGQGIGGCNMVSEVVGLCILGGKFHQSQGRGHDGNEDGWTRVALTAMVGRMLEVLGLFKFVRSWVRVPHPD